MPKDAEADVSLALLTARLRQSRAPGAPMHGLAGMRTLARAARAGRTEELTLALTTITPVYGGGTTAGAIDPYVPFRPRAIKNGLRHWWWLLNRHLPDYLETAQDDEARREKKRRKLYDDMVAIWGGAGMPGEELAARVSVEVGEVSDVRFAPFVPWKIQKNMETGVLGVAQDSTTPWLYALFGAKGELKTRPDLSKWRHGNCIFSGGTFAHRFGKPTEGRWKAKDLADFPGLFDKHPQSLILPGAEFKLTIRWETDALTAPQIDQVKTALAFWLVFGGIGARTSRGLGRMTCSEFNAWEYINRRQTLGAMTIQASPPGTPADGHSAERSMCWLLDAYRNFRQSRNPGGQRPGRSYWHKAEVVRRHYPGYIYTGHRTELGHPFDNDWLPELLFGAPIIVQYQRGNAGRDDPSGSTELTFGTQNGSDKIFSRYASPLFFGLKKIQNPEGQQWCPQVLYLHARPDFREKQISAVLKFSGGQPMTRISAGTWWVDFASPTYQADQTGRTNAFGNVPNMHGASSPISAFLRQIFGGRLMP